MSETDYYQAVEEFFVSKRGDPLFLSNSDWLLVHRWRTEGLPLRIVLRGIADTFEGKALGWSRDRKVGSLSYCRREVEAARDRWQLALALGEEEGASLPEHLQALAEGLERAAGLGPRAGALAAQAAAELRACSGAPGEPRALEARLMAREQELVEALAGEAGAAERTALEEELDRELAPYRERMPQPVLERVRREGRVRRLFARHGLPRLSLFAL